jgi:hypothetical protein
MKTTAQRRRRLARLAILACTPYLGLKLLWVCGVDLGVNSLGDVGRGTWIAINLFTFLLDGIAALLAHHLASPKSLRTPAWLITFPMWAASGLLATVMLAVPIASAAGLLLNHPLTEDGADSDVLQPWVFGLVYSGLIAEGITLIAAFGYYAHERWGTLLRTPIRELADPAGTATVQRVLGILAAAGAGTAGAVHLYWALSSDGTRITEVVIDGVLGIAALAGATGLLMLVLRRAGARTLVRLPLALAWFGVGAIFTWGGWTWLGTLSAIGSNSGTEPLTALQMLVYALEMITGTAALSLGCFALTEITAAQTEHADTPPARETLPV